MNEPTPPHVLPSTLGLSLDGMIDWETRCATVRRAWDLGVRVLDLSPTPEPLGTLEKLRLRFPEIVRQAFIVLTPEAADTSGATYLGPNRPPGGEANPGATAFANAAQRVLGKPADFFAIPWTRDGGFSRSASMEDLRHLIQDRRLISWGPDFGDDFAGSHIDEALADGARAAIVRANLLHPHTLAAYSSQNYAPSVPIVVRDPFDGGRLSGELVAPRTASSLSLQGPTPVAELERTFRPVLRLRFLTESRKRSLAQAALQYLLQNPRVGCILLPEAGPERLAEWVGSRERTPLTQLEIERVEAGHAAPVSAPSTERERSTL